MQTSFAHSIEDDPQKRQLDEQCKIVLSHKPLLARILKRTVEEVADMEIDEIIASIEGSPSMETSLSWKERNGLKAVIQSQHPGMKELYITTFVFISLSNEGKTKILFDVEAQKNYYPGYKIVTRGLVYCARMISSQINQEFDLKHYDN